jgi:hypothetical protein
MTKHHRIDPATGKVIVGDCILPEGYQKEDSVGSQCRDTKKVHSAAEAHHGYPCPEGLVHDHLCNETGCQNGAHIEYVTHSENMRRAWARGTKVACPEHSYETVRTVIWLRLGCGWKLKDIYRLTGVKGSMVSHWVSGHRSGRKVAQAKLELGLI